MVLIKGHKIVYSRLNNTFVPKKRKARQVSTRQGGVAPLTSLVAFFVILLRCVFFYCDFSKRPNKNQKFRT